MPRFLRFIAIRSNGTQLEKIVLAVAQGKAGKDAVAGFLRNNARLYVGSTGRTNDG